MDGRGNLDWRPIWAIKSSLVLDSIMGKKRPKVPGVHDHFELRAAAGLAGLRPHMVDYLCRERILVPTLRSSPGRGRPRLFSYTDIVLLRALAHLLRAGISVKKLKVALNFLQSSDHEIASTSEATRFLVTDGSEVYYRSRENLVQELTEGRQIAFTFVIEMERVRKEVETEMRVLNRPSAKRSARRR